MRKLKFFIIATSMFALFSCSNNIAPLLDEVTTEDTTSDGIAISENKENDTTDDSSIDSEITDWDDGGEEDITATEVKPE